MNKLIKIEIKNHYGVDHYYVVSEHQEYINALTRNKTVSTMALKALGFEFEIKQPSIAL